MSIRIDDRYPDYLIAYEGEHEHDINQFQPLVERWIARCERQQRFGVIYVTEFIHDHDDDEHDHEHERDGEYEEAFSRMLNDFRRQYHDLAARWTVGFVRVLPADWIAKRTAENPDLLANAQADTDRMARYIWGIPGTILTSVEDAHQWLDQQRQTVQPGSDTPSKITDAAGRVGLFYGSTTGLTEYVAQEIETAWAAAGMEPLVAQNIGDVPDLAALLDYDHLILGCPTWNIGQLQDDWDIAFPQFDKLDFSGKQVALFGVGDQYGYPDNFIDAVGTLGNKLEERGASLVGFWPCDGYEFSASKAVRNKVFIGLAIDEEHQSKQTPARISQWLEQVIAEFVLRPVVNS